MSSSRSMGLLKPPVELVQYGLRAMKVVAMADGTFDDRERMVMRAACDAFDVQHDVDAIIGIDPDELAQAIIAEPLRKQLIGGLLVLAMADEDASPAELFVIEAFARAFGIDAPYVRIMQKIVDGHTLIARFDMMRRVWAIPKIAEYAKNNGLGWLVRELAAFAKLREDTAVAERYRALERAPAGSLGRGYFDFARSNGFSLPGEKGSPPEPIVLHDFTHVLTGYDTTADGELQIAFFHAGSKKVDPFFFSFFSMLQFHLEFKLAPAAPAMRGNFDPAKAMAALSRGAGSAIDPLDAWDPWTVVHEPVAELRARYRI